LKQELGRRPEREYVFCPYRDWAFDLAYPDLMMAVELEGQSHNRFGQSNKDMEKFNYATRDGWKVLRYPASMILTKTGKPCLRLSRIVDQIVAMVCEDIMDEWDTEIITGVIR
jgi:very-short-patch-repair endonuclease